MSKLQVYVFVILYGAGEVVRRPADANQAPWAGEGRQGPANSSLLFGRDGAPSTGEAATTVHCRWQQGA